MFLGDDECAARLSGRQYDHRLRAGKVANEDEESNQKGQTKHSDVVAIKLHVIEWENYKKYYIL